MECSRSQSGAISALCSHGTNKKAPAFGRGFFVSVILFANRVLHSLKHADRLIQTDSKSCVDEVAGRVAVAIVSLRLADLLAFTQRGIHKAVGVARCLGNLFRCGPLMLLRVARMMSDLFPPFEDIFFLAMEFSCATEASMCVDLSDPRSFTTLVPRFDPDSLFGIGGVPISDVETSNASV